MKKEFFKRRLLFAASSIVFHVFLAYFFMTVHFNVYQPEVRRIITVVPISNEKIFFPEITKESPNNNLTLQPGKKKKTGPAAAKPEQEQPLQPTNNIQPPTEPPGTQKQSQKEQPTPEPGTIIAEKPGKPLTAPFDPSRYLKHETLEEIFRERDDKRLAKRHTKRKNRWYNPPDKTEEPPIGDRSWVGDDVVVDPGNIAFFQGRGFDISPWAKQVAALVNRNWSILSILQVQGKVEVGIALTVDRDGKILKSGITRSSQMQVLDQAALNAITFAKPFPSLPEHYPGENLDAYLLFNYRFPEDDTEELNSKNPRKQDTFISKFGLMKSTFFKQSRLPGELSLGLVCRGSAHYRLIYKDNIVDGGELREGLNFINIPTSGLFKQPGSHHYTLDLKTPSETIKRIILLDIDCHSPTNSGQVRDEVRETGYGLAVFIENKMLAYHKKTVKHRQLNTIELSRRNTKLDRMGNHAPDPLDPMGKKYERASIPVLALPFLAYKHLLKPKLEKKKVRIPKLYKHLAKTFLVRENKTDKPLDVEISVEITGAS